MFVDASALVAVLSGEVEKSRVERAIRSAPQPFTSSLAILEVVLALARPDKWNVPPDQVGRSVQAFLEEVGIAVRVPDDPIRVSALASEAATRFRSGRRGLNLADCMHYAYARHFGAPMLATADEFRQTDFVVVP